MSGIAAAPSGPGLSVIVPTRNVAGTIADCLRGLLEELAGSAFEVIVVDNGSRDATLDIVRTFPVALHVVGPCFVSRSRNEGARAATLPLVAFVDSDCVVQPGWAATVRAVLADAGIGVTGSRHILRADATWVERAWDRAHRKRAEAALVDTVYIPAGNLAARREVFLAVDGFDETLETGEDPDLCARIAAGGRRIVEARDMRCVHLGEPRTLGDVFRRERWHGRGARLHYGDGRLAPITLATAAFGGALAFAAASLVAAIATGVPWLLAGLLAPAAVPAVYAASYGRGDPRHTAQLWAIYLAYFLARTAAFPVAVARALERRRAAAGTGAGMRA
jgi:GT2 family glycosyltransferase